MYLRFLLICVLLTACDPNDINLSEFDPLPVTRTDVLVIGDSNSDPAYNNFYNMYERLGFSLYNKDGKKTAVQGHRITNKTPDRYWTPGDYGTIILDRGVNDALRNEPLDDFEAALKRFINYDTGAKFYCVLPHATRDDIDVEPYRAIMIEECPNVIDPRIVGISLRDDGVHRTENDNHLIQPLFGGI